MTPEQYAKSHQKAFRSAFDFLNAHFPPGDTDEWWLQMAQDGSYTASMMEGNDLAIELLTAVTNYIGNEYKRRHSNDSS